MQYKVPTVESVEPKKFKPHDPDAKKYLDEHGYVVFSEVAAQDETEKAIELFWKHMTFMTKNKVKQNDPSTWQNYLWPGLSHLEISDVFFLSSRIATIKSGDTSTGIFFDYGVPKYFFF